MVELWEYALLALRVYKKPDFDQRGPLPPGWDVIEENPDDTLGFSVGAYRKTGTSEIVISFTGTNGAMDWVTGNVPAGLGLVSSQLIEAIRFYADIRAANPDAQITFTGHSLGGGIASVMSIFFDHPSTIFDPAPFQLSAVDPIALLGFFDYYTGYQLLNGRAPETSFASYMARASGSHDKAMISSSTSWEGRPMRLLSRTGMRARISSSTRFRRAGRCCTPARSTASSTRWQPSGRPPAARSS